MEEISTLEGKLLNRKLQQEYAGYTEKVAYLIWVPETASLPPMYIDDTHYAVFQCLRKIFPGDLLDNSQAKASSFSVRFEKTALSDVPYLYIISVLHGEHRITRQVSSTRRPTYESTEKFEAHTVHFVDIDQVDIYRNDKVAQTKLRTLDQPQIARAIPIKIFETMREDNKCLHESLFRALTK